MNPLKIQSTHSKTGKSVVLDRMLLEVLVGGYDCPAEA